MELRDYTPDDAEPTRAVFLRAVRRTASAHHTPAQVTAWADEGGDPASWAVAREAPRTRVATVDGAVVGFVDLDDEGYVDMLFVDPDVGRQGIATSLLASVIALARGQGLSSLTTFASPTSRPVFARQGFVFIGERVFGEGDGAATTSEMRLALVTGEG